MALKCSGRQPIIFSGISKGGIEMYRSEAKCVLREIQSIPDSFDAVVKYRSRLKEIENLKSYLGLPKSPSIGGVRLENAHTDPKDKLHELYYEEEQIKLRIRELEKDMARAQRFRRKIMDQIDESDQLFVKAYLEGVSREMLKANFSFENPYMRMLTILKDVDLFY